MSDSIFEIEVRVPNKIFVIYGKPVRSPFKLRVNDDEAKRIITSIKSLGLLDYSVVEVETKLRTNIESTVLKKGEKSTEIKPKDLSLDGVIKVIKSYKLSEEVPDKLDELTTKANEVKNKLGNIDET